MVRGVDVVRGEDLDCWCNLPRMPAMLLASSHYSFPLGPPQRSLLSPLTHRSPLLFACSLSFWGGGMRQNCRPVGMACPSCRGWEDKGTPLSLALNPWRWEWMWSLAQCCVGWGWTWDTQVQVYKSNWERPWLKSRDYMQLKYWGDYIICGALQANLFAAFSICHSVSMVSRLVRDRIFKPNRWSLKLESWNGRGIVLQHRPAERRPCAKSRELQSKPGFATFVLNSFSVPRFPHPQCAVSF